MADLWREDTPRAIATPTQARLAREHAERMKRWHPPEPKAAPKPPEPEPAEPPHEPEPLILPGTLKDWRDTVEPMPSSEAPAVRPPSWRLALRVAAAHFDLTFAQALSQARERDRVHARQIAMTLCLEMIPGVGLSQVGRWFGRDHTTVLHARDTINERIASDPDFAKEVDAIRAAVRARAR